MAQGTIIAAGARYDPINGLQAVVVITADNGGKVSDLNPHSLHAAQLGHTWTNIEAATFQLFTSPQAFCAYVQQTAPTIANIANLSTSSSGSGVSTTSVLTP